jgi:WD40 repeat protein
MKSVSPSFLVSSATSTQLLHEDLMGVFRETDVNVKVNVNVKEERDSTQTRRRDDDALTSSPRFALVGDVVRADAGVRCLTRCPRVFNPRESSDRGDGVGAFAAATSSRVLHVIADVSRGESPRGGKTKTFSRRLDDAHAGPCSVYAVAWAAADNGGGGVVATGANDGGLALTEVLYSDGAEDPLRLDEKRETFRFGGSCVTRNAVRGGAIRAVAFVGAAASPDFDSGDELLRAADARLVVCAGEGDFKPRAWQLDESGLAFAGPSFSLGAHGAPVIAAAADPDTRWLLFTASRAGEAFLWDLRESRGARENLAARPSLRCDVAGACGDGASLSSATIRGGRFAFGFINGGVAAADARRGCNSVAFGGVRRANAFGGAGSSVVWSDVVHPGFECRSVDIAPRGSSVSSGGSRNDYSACAAFQSPFLILSGGFDGRVALSDASSNGRGSVWSCENAHADKVTAARFDARGAGFVSCGVDRVVKAWALRDENRDRL